MSKFTQFRDWLDTQDNRVDLWLDSLRGSPYTARVMLVVALALLGVVLWLLLR